MKIVLGVISLIVIVTAMVLYPSMVTPQSIKNEIAAQATLKQISYAEKIYQQMHKGQLGTLKQLYDANLFGLTFENEKIEIKDGYKFELKIINDGFVVNATPAKYGTTGRVSYFMNVQGIIHAGSHEGKEASETDAICLPNGALLSLGLDSK